ncbi:hypothetical protein FLONG3_6550 [Fusarium longipes]|uniref:Uncharacterized protein n=1 Tax=Fusarium longipes TaxID=694270 RepID=A0A395SLI1_9HYPO|nr:hypothetical protein FLONG3_6550 [Fusarium longipes]
MFAKTPPRVSLLGLPMELREQIYHAYFEVEGGYVHDGVTDTLVQSNGDPIDIALRYTCCSIAHETKDLPFRINSVKFSAVCRDDWQEMANAFGWIRCYHGYLQKELLLYMKHYITPDMYHPSNSQYLDYMPSIGETIDHLVGTEPPDGKHHHLQPFKEQWQRVSRPSGLGDSGFDASQLVRKFGDTNIILDRTIEYLLRILAKRHPDQFTQAVDIILPGWTDSHPSVDILDLTFNPWDIPSTLEVITMARALLLEGEFDRFTAWETLASTDNYDPRNIDPRYTGTRYQYRKMAFFSASAVAIRFVNQINKQQRLSMRRIILNEDRPAVSQHMCHAIGLIPFCKEDTKLHVEHCWNLWSTLLLGTMNRSTFSVARNFE